MACIHIHIDVRRKNRFFTSKKLAIEWIKFLKDDEKSGNFCSDISTEEQRNIILAYRLAASKGLSIYRCILQTPPQINPKPLSVSDAILEY